jgi:hypothetical protein
MAKKAVGRPSLYSDELADKICERIAMSEEGLHAICKEEGMPSFPTVFNWLNDSEKKYFLDKYMRAREAQADLLSDQIIDIADTCVIGIKTKETKDGIMEETGDMVDRSRLRVDARKWKASKLAPKKYGDSLDITTGGDKLTYNVKITDGTGS